ncbi:MAG: cyclic nucleotide-binding domain-containing protein [Candidatus Riflebacteria bacterium]|nr:cyclic nucleotide-binding domain-containing protein [Candidatus Riflebacteria bacterium]
MKKVLFILGELTDADIEWMIRNGKKRTVAAGTVLINEGKDIDSIFIIIDGQFSVKVAALKNQVINRISSGEILGEISCVDSRPPSATVVSESEAMVLEINRNELNRHLKDDNGFAARFYKAMAVFLADRLRSTFAFVGYGESEKLEENVEYKDELDSALLDNVSMAGARFDTILKRMRG